MLNNLLYSKGYLALAKKGENYVYLCPFHEEKTPSFSVNDKGFHCFGCGISGGYAQLNKLLKGDLQQFKHITSFDAINKFSDSQQQNKDTTTLLQVMSTIKRRASQCVGHPYLQAKGLTTIYPSVYWYQSNIVVFSQGSVSYQYITLEGTKMFPKGADNSNAYVNFIKYHNSDKIVYTEGLADALSVYDSDSNARFCFGSEGLKNQLKLNVENKDNIIIAIDNDTAGHMVYSLANSLGYEDFLKFDDEENNFDVNDFFKKYGKDCLTELLKI